MNITQFALDKKRVTFTALFLIIVTGWITYQNMPRAEDPGFVIRTALVTTYFPGAGPERVELLITDKIEKVVQEMPEIESIVSQSKPGISIVYVNIKERYKTMRPIWDDLRRKVDAARSELPSGIHGPIVNDDFGDVYGTLISITGDGYSYAELKQVADDCRNELLLIPNVAKVSIVGVQDERVFVEFNNSRMAELGISPGQLKQILESRNIVFPGGQVFTADEQISLEPSGNFESVDEMRRTVIKLPGRSELVYLGDIADIHRGYVDPPQSIVRYNGIPALVLAVSLREGGNIIDLGRGVNEKLIRFQERYPIGLEFSTVYFQPFFVDKKIDEFSWSLVQAVLIVITVMLVFLGIRTGLVVASLIPMAMLMAIMVMGFFGMGLNQMSLAALIISLGLLVDNAIVMSESIMVQISEGKTAVKAAIDSARELRIPLLTSSLTTAAAFLPIYLAESTTGEYTAPIFEVVTITLLCSWILALTMTPLLCVLFLKVKKGSSGQGYQTPFYRRYRGMLLGVLRHPWMTILATVLIFIGVLQLTAFIPNIFFPANDKPLMYAELKLPVGTPLVKTEELLGRVESFIRSEMMAERDASGGVTKHGILEWTSFVGNGPPRFQLSLNVEPPSPGYVYMLLNTTDRWKMETDIIPRLDRFCEQNFPDMTTSMGPLTLGPPVESPVQIRVSGNDANEVFRITDRVMAQLEKIPGTRNIRDNWGARTKKLFVRINQPRAQRAGLTSQDIATSLQSILSGITTTDFREEDEVIPVVLRSVAADRKDIGKLETHSIYVQSTGRTVPLKQVADVEVQFQPAKVLRRDRLKTVTVNADIYPGFNAIAIAQDLNRWLAEESRNWPIGYRYELGGEIESSGKAGNSINEKLPIAGLFIILLLVAQFDSIRRPIIILLTIPLGLIGVIIGLLVTQQPLGFMAFLGVISLAGIVINNAIVLIDRIKIEIDNGLSPANAILESSQRRLRPILLTTGTTIGGLVPLWLGGGPLFEAMAVAILFGLMFATVLTLGIVPVLYSLFFRISVRDFPAS
jgi:multidrug efflux pump